MYNTYRNSSKTPCSVPGRSGKTDGGMRNHRSSQKHVHRQSVCEYSDRQSGLRRLEEHKTHYIRHVAVGRLSPSDEQKRGMIVSRSILLYFSVDDPTLHLLSQRYNIRCEKKEKKTMSLGRDV